MTLTVERPRPEDRAGWEALFSGYRAFYRQAEDQTAAETVWRWILADGGPLEGRIARSRHGELVGLMHFRDVPRPLEGSTGGWLDDLFVAEAARGSGIADALMEALCEIGRERGWTCMRWLTSRTNERAQTFYDRVAAKTEFLTYEIRL